MNRLLQGFWGVLFAVGCGRPLVVEDLPFPTPRVSLPSEVPQGCEWAAEPQLAVTFSGQPSTLVRSGEALFSSWLSVDTQEAPVHVLRTDLGTLTTTPIWAGDATHALIGATADAVYLLVSDDAPSWSEVQVLDHAGATRRTASLRGLSVNGFTGVRVGKSLFAISNQGLMRESEAGWQRVGTESVARFVSPPNATELLVLDARGEQVCAVDEAAMALAPCVAVPTDLAGTRVWDVWLARHRGAQWGLSAFIEPGGTGVLTYDGAQWQLTESTGNRWMLNDLIDVEGGWLWLRQENVEQNTFRTLAFDWSKSSSATELWRVDGQAYSLTPTRCGLAFAVTPDGIHTVRLPSP
ncbi:MAG: hypothetical protein IPJ65_34420 [Archangiaceae bacterium]|nr:hypothetical protein [Archangiaceae bacterium]